MFAVRAERYRENGIDVILEVLHLRPVAASQSFTILS